MARAAGDGGAKQRRRKQILITGGLLFAVLLAVQVPRTLKLLRVPATTGTGTPESVDAPVPSVANAPATSGGGAETGQLASLSRFMPKRLFAPSETVAASAAPLGEGAASEGPILPGFAFGSALPPPPRVTPPRVTPPRRPAAPRPSARLSGHVVVLHSVPKGSGRAEADRAARQLRSAGFRGVRVLDSGNYRTLRRGYYAVVSRAYRTRAEALAARRVAQSRGIDKPYVRPLVR